MDPTSLLIQAVMGAIGGHAQGAANQGTNMGPVGNTITGAIGGLGGSALTGLIPALGGALGQGGLSAGNVAGGGIGGIILTLIVGYITQQMNANSNTPK